MLKQSVCAMAFAMGALAPAPARASGETAAAAAYDHCNAAAATPMAKILSGHLGPHLDCSAAYTFYKGGEDAPADPPYPLSARILLIWDTASLELRNDAPSAALSQTRTIVEADQESPLSAEWFAATRSALLPGISDWTAFDAATPNAEGVIVFEFPEGETYRGPIIDRNAAGAILLIDLVDGNF